MEELIRLFPEKEFHIGDRGGGYNSTALRSDLEGHRDWLPAYVYESLKRCGC